MSTPRTFRLTLAYDGTEFHGWQKQPEVRTVQGELETALGRVLGEVSVAVAGAGRTDKGVHARGQVATFAHATPLPARAFAPLLGKTLPRDVRVLDATEMADGFHARHSARARRYAYRLLAAPDVLRERYAWAIEPLPVLAALQAAAAPLRGRHDYSAFQAASEAQPEPVCEVFAADWSACDDGMAFHVVASHFLYHMVRKLVGTTLDAVKHPDPGSHVRHVLESRDRARAGRMAPAHGLCLEQVYFEGDALR